MEKHDIVAVIAAMLIAGSFSSEEPLSTAEAIDWAVDIVALTNDKLYRASRIDDD